MTSKGAFGFTYTRSQVTLETFRNLLREIPTDDENVSWLRGMLFPNEENLNEVEMTEEVKEFKGDEEDEGSGTCENISDEKTLWSWGIMDYCPEPPTADVKMDDQVPVDELDPTLMKDVLKRLSFNLFMLKSPNPVMGSFTDMAKAFCVVCQDSLHCEFDVKYNKFVFVNTTSFQVDLDLVGRMFGDLVPLAYILSLDNLESLSVVELLKKMASLRVLCLDTKSKRELAVADWTFKYTPELLDIETSIPKMENVKYLEKLVKGWKNPFKVNEETLSNCILYSHTPCLRLLVNSHLRWAKAKANLVGDEELRKTLKRLTLV